MKTASAKLTVTILVIVIGIVIAGVTLFVLYVKGKQRRGIPPQVVILLCIELFTLTSICFYIIAHKHK